MIQRIGSTLTRVCAGQTAPRARFSPGPPDLDPTDQIHPPRVKPSLTLAVLQGNPRVSLDLQAVPSTLGFFLGLGPVFFILAQEV
jgi:hypothetical protein